MTLPEMPFYAEMPTNRVAERIGPYELSVQASHSHYCSPRKDGLPINAYTAVEVAIVYHFPDGKTAEFIRPQDARLPFCWAYDDVASMPREDVERLRAMLIKRTQRKGRRPHRGVQVKRVVRNGW